MRFNKKNYLIVTLFIGFVLQYNFLFSAEFLWLNFWSGSGIRTSISFFVIFLCLLPYSIGLNLKFRAWSVIPALLIYVIYGFTIGLLSNTPSLGMIAEGIFWLEIALYFVILNNLDRESLSSLIQAILIYSALNAIASIGYFWLIKDQIAVAALVGDQRIVRIADLLSPLLALLYILYNSIYLEKKLSTAWLIPLILLILLGMFRSVWAAFILSYIFTNLLFPTLDGFKKMITNTVTALVVILIFEQIFEHFFSVESVIIGRIIAGIGTEDSLGRISSAGDVFSQFINEPFSIIFGAGYGKLVWFVNDFGDGEVLALQPLGSLSNFYIVFLYQVGIFVAMAYLLYTIYCLFWIGSRYSKSNARLLTFVGLYFFLQWLTFPTSIHYPIAIIIGIYFTLATNIMPTRTTNTNQ